MQVGNTFERLTLKYRVEVSGRADTAGLERLVEPGPSDSRGGRFVSALSAGTSTPAAFRLSSDTLAEPGGRSRRCCQGREGGVKGKVGTVALF